jgi:hypothetical protein
MKHASPCTRANDRCGKNSRSVRWATLGQNFVTSLKTTGNNQPDARLFFGHAARLPAGSWPGTAPASNPQAQRRGRAQSKKAAVAFVRKPGIIRSGRLLHRRPARSPPPQSPHHGGTVLRAEVEYRAKSAEAKCGIRFSWASGGSVMKLIHRFKELAPENRPQDPHLDGTGLRFESLDHGGEYPDTMPQAIKLTDAEGRSCSTCRSRWRGR